MISCMARMSCGNWMIGRPIHEKLYVYLYFAEASIHRRELSRSFTSAPWSSMSTTRSASNSSTGLSFFELAFVFIAILCGRSGSARVLVHEQGELPERVIVADGR